MTPAMPRGARLLVLAQISKAATLLIGLTVLSRILSPVDFGYVAVPVAIIGIGEILRDMGLSAAAITQPNLALHQRDVLFWINVAIGLLLAIALILAAPLLSVAFDNVPMSQVLPVLSIVFLVNGAGAQFRADLNRRLKFTALSIIDSIAPFVGVLSAIVAGHLGAGYWALVIQQVATSVLVLVLLVGLGRWLPGPPRRWRESKRLLVFGANVSWSQILAYLGNNIDTLALGVWASAAQLGGYTRAFQMAVQPLALLKTPASSVAMPMLARRRDDPVGFARGVAVGQLLLGYTVVPLAGLLAACASPVVLLVLGRQWHDVVPYVALLAIAGCLQQTASVANWMFMAGNFGRSLRRYSSTAFVVKAVLVIAAAPFGALWVAAAYLGSVAVLTPIALTWACRTCGVSLGVVARAASRPLFAAAVAAVSAYIAVRALDAAHDVLQLLGGFGAFGVVYLALGLLRSFRGDYVYVVTTLLRR